MWSGVGRSGVECGLEWFGVRFGVVWSVEWSGVECGLEWFGVGCEVLRSAPQLAFAVVSTRIRS